MPVADGFAMGMDGITAAGFLAGALAGLSGSLHCFLMCGPLACAGVRGGPARAGRLTDATSYHLARIAAYGAVGALLGLVGKGAAAALSVSLRPWLPWVLAGALVLTAFPLPKKLGALPGISVLLRTVGKISATLAPPFRAAAIGALTPLLPCGLVYGLSAVAIAAGTATDGAATFLGFALGATPALVAGQLQAGLLRSLGPFPAALLRRALPLAAAAVLVVRALRDTGGGEGSCH